MIHAHIKSADTVRSEGRYLRRIIRRNRAGLTRAEVEILVCVVNLWMHHRSGPKGFIHPGRELVAKRAKTSVVTVARAFGMFRQLGLMNATKHLNGGHGKATQYKVDLTAIIEIFDPSNVVTIGGELVQCTVSLGRQNDTVHAYQNDTLSIGTYKAAREAKVLSLGNAPHVPSSWKGHDDV